jgi:4-carboxymuconolactone decarboxylase
MGRLRELDPDLLDAEQRSVYDAIVASRGGSIAGPFAAWLRSPVMADRAQSLGEFCRYHTSLPARLSELAILITARQWRANVEWQIHAPIARREGLSDELLAALQSGEEPCFQREDERIVYQLALQLYESRRVSSATYQAAVAALGEAAVVELVGLLGYYALVAMTLNVFDVQLTDQQSRPFPD